MPSLIQTLLRLKPQPYGGQFIRLGGQVDGAYLIPDDLSGISICISPGAADTKGFEDELWESYQIPSLLIDRSSTFDGFTTPMKAGQTLIQKWLDPIDSPDSISLSSILHQARALEKQADCLLQIDIEGGEYLNITRTAQDLLTAFRIIVIEFHNLGDLLRPWSRWHRPIKETIAALSHRHVCVHAHPNNCCGQFIVPGTEINIPQVLECTYLRKDRLIKPRYFAQDKADEAVTVLPHPLDIRNVLGKPELVLNGVWSGADEHFRGRLARYVPRWQHYANEFLRTVAQRIRRAAF